MGFRAPSADEVYQYFLRVDEQERTLTDRFGWSILLIGDYSPEYQEFLSRYCLDLCARTADRIRLVFFSGIPESGFDQMARELRVRSDRGRHGLLGTVLDRVAGRSRPSQVDFEDGYWRGLRPQAFVPFTDTRQIQAHLGWQCEMMTAMPGADEGMKFAQRLGIGRYVPCALLVTDIGALEVAVLPFEVQSMEGIYQRIRGWIDTYYEVNREILEHWTQVEKQIEALTRQASGSLRAVREWPELRRREWRSLGRAAQLALALRQGEDVALDQLDSLAREYTMPSALRTTYSGLQRKFAEFEKQSRARQDLAALAKELGEQNDPAAIGSQISKLAKTRSGGMSDAGHQAAKRASSALLEPFRPPGPPQQEIIAWWERSALPPFTRNAFFHERHAWHSVAASRRRQDESIPDHKRRDYAAFAAAVGACPLTQDAVASTRQVVTALAEHYGVSAASPEWISDTDALTTHLTRSFQQLHSTAPAWLAHSSPTLLIAECVPLGAHITTASLAQFLGSATDLNRLVERVEASAPTEEELNKLRLSRYLHHRDAVSRELENDSAALHTVDSDRRSALAALATFLETARADLEARLLSRPSGKTGPLDGLDADEMIQLDQALGEYRRAAGSVTYGHLEDPAVVHVPIRTGLWQAAGLARKPSAPGTPIVDQLRSSIAKATGDYRTAAAEWPRMRQEGAELYPAALLAKAFIRTLSVARLEELLRPYPGSTTRERTDHIVRQGLTRTLLDTMTEPERDSLAVQLPLQHIPSGMHASPIDAILAALGLAAGTLGSKPPRLSHAASGRTLGEKILHDEFDVFMAHHSTDKQFVRTVGELLRRHDIYPWIDEEQIQPGRWFQDGIQSAIHTVRTAAVFYGRDGLGPWQRGEVRAFVNRCLVNDTPVIPILLPGVPEIVEELLFLRQLQAVRFVGDAFDRKALEKLIWGITSVRPQERR
jgi:hypothetical protein